MPNRYNSKMTKSTLFIIATIGLFSCKQANKSTPEAVQLKAENSVKNAQPDKEVYTKYLYTDSNGKNLILQNSYPRGGTKYTDPKGNVCSYAMFSTHIINETDNPLLLDIDFSIKSYEISNFPGKYFKMLVPADIKAIDKFPSETDLKSFLDNNIDKPSSFIRTINPKESSSVYFIMLISTLEPTGMTRTELSLKGQGLSYKISRYSKTTLLDEKEINCGSINLKNLRLMK